jgi:predicted nucleotidyltransferase
MEDNEKYGLTISDIWNIVSVFRHNQKIKEVILFGSRAKGTFANGSDIDIALKGEDMTTKDITTALLLLDELFLPYKFDLIIFDRINEQALIGHIKRVGKVLYRRS